MLSSTFFITSTQMLKIKHISLSLLSKTLWERTEESMFKQGFLGSNLKNMVE